MKFGCIVGVGSFNSHRLNFNVADSTCISKDCLPYLFHSFRNKYFNKISLDNMLYFQNKLYKF